MEANRPWIIPAGFYPGQKLLWNGRNFPMSWQGSLNTSMQVFDLSSAVGAYESEWAISVEGAVDTAGNLIYAKGKATKTVRGTYAIVESVAFTLRNLPVTSKVTEANRLVISYTLSGPQIAEHIQEISGSKTSPSQIQNYKSTEWNLRLQQATTLSLAKP